MMETWSPLSWLIPPALVTVELFCVKKGWSVPTFMIAV
jgi:hypothetical protein